MQMFVLDNSPLRSAQALADTHIRVIGREITMLLSSWYYYNSNGNKDDLPYKPMKNQPLAKQFDNVYARRWAITNAFFIFKEFSRRFGKPHASEAKYWKLRSYIQDNDMKTLFITDADLKAVFTFVEKGKGIKEGLNTKEVVALYRRYYIEKLKTMKVKTTYTNTNCPNWANKEN